MTPKMQTAIRTAADRCSELTRPWLIGGSCGLLLQGVHLEQAPRDLDLYIDEEAVGDFHRALSDFAVDEPAFSVTDKYSSTLSHYNMGGIPVELVAGFEVKVTQAAYRVDVAGCLSRFSSVHVVGEAIVRCMPLSHELLFNLLRERPDRYESIASSMRRDKDAHLPALRALAAANHIGDLWLRRMCELLHLQRQVLVGSEEVNPCRE